jgi:uncharacterized membrane protein
MSGLGDLPGGSFFSFANDISADGAAVVGVSSGTAGFRAIVWDAMKGIRDLADVLADLGVEVSGWTLDEAMGISDDGRVIVGSGSKVGVGGAWMVVLDEPIASAAKVPGLSPVGIMCLVGLLCLLGLVAFRQRDYSDAASL